jgi:hypothetical protein
VGVLERAEITFGVAQTLGAMPSRAANVAARCSAHEVDMDDSLVVIAIKL